MYMYMYMHLCSAPIYSLKSEKDWKGFENDHA
jgi:hypothetical protein